MDFGLTYWLGLLGFLVLIPFILIYLIKPKALKMSIPSLMFFEKTSKSKVSRTFLKKLLKNLLFLIQFIVLLLLAFSLAGPWLSFKEIVSSKNTVIVMDVSASMQAGDRFDNAISNAVKMLGRRNTIILAGTQPKIALERVSRHEAKSFLKSLAVTDSSSNIGDAIILAGEVLKDVDGRVLVFSDFVHTKGMVPLTAKNVLESKGIPVNFVSFGGETFVNAGIVNIKVEEDKSTLYLKNYHVLDVDCKLKVNEKLYEVSLPAGSIKPIIVENGEGVTEVSVLYEDDFVVDNRAYMSIPSEDEVKVLIVTSSEQKYLKSALEAAGNIKVDVVEPLVVHSLDSYDVFIFVDIDKSKYLVGTLDEVVSLVSEGKSLVLFAQRDMLDLDGYRKVLPVKVGSILSSYDVSVALGSKFTKNVEFGSVSDYFRAENKEGKVVSVAMAGNDTVVSLATKGEGKVVYYGLMESESDFRLSPSYPVFWVNLVQYLSGRPGIEDTNLIVGENVYLPDGSYLSFDNVGVFKKGGVNYAVNLANERESDVNAKYTEGKLLEGFNLSKMKEEVLHELEWYLVLVGFIFVVLEIVYLKWRGGL